VNLRLFVYELDEAAAPTACLIAHSPLSCSNRSIGLSKLCVRQHRAVPLVPRCTCCSAVCTGGSFEEPGVVKSRGLCPEVSLTSEFGSTPTTEEACGQQIRHRLNRGGNRQANRALHTMVIIRLRLHEPTRSYVERRPGEGKTKKEVIRCLKRHAAREIFSTLCRDRGPVAA
jgi:hypothetical protein